MDSSFCSNFARKEATPLGEMAADMTEHQATLATAMLKTAVEGSDKEGDMVRQSCIEARLGVECLLTSAIDLQSLYTTGG